MLQRLSEEEFSVMKARVGKGGVKGTSRRKPESAGSSPAPSLHNGYRSKLEAAYAKKLDLDRLAHFIDYWRYEPLNLRLPGQKNFYKPDFLCVGDKDLIFYEIKGRNKSDDRSLVKMKTAAGLNPWAKFVLVKRVNGQWEEREIR